MTAHSARSCADDTPVGIAIARGAGPRAPLAGRETVNRREAAAEMRRVAKFGEIADQPDGQVGPEQVVGRQRDAGRSNNLTDADTVLGQAPLKSPSGKREMVGGQRQRPVRRRIIDDELSGAFGRRPRVVR